MRKKVMYLRLLWFAYEIYDIYGQKMHYGVMKFKKKKKQTKIAELK